jgi:tRNA threonylcarbamoyladenosine biosynthesis protein TsaE
VVVHSASVEATRTAGAECARTVQAGAVLALCGALGTGKTEFVRGFVAALNPQAMVRSPSFTLVNVNETPRFPVYHFDFYRLGKAGELGEIGFYDYADGTGVCLVEWADMFLCELPGESTKVVRFSDTGENSREIEFQ